MLLGNIFIFCPLSLSFSRAPQRTNTPCFLYSQPKAEHVDMHITENSADTQNVLHMDLMKENH